MNSPRLAIAAMALSMLSLSAQAGPIVQNGDFSMISVSGGNFYNPSSSSGATVTDWALYPGTGTYTGGPLGYDLFSGTDYNAAGGSYESLEGGPYPGDGANTNFVAIDGSCCNTSTNPTLGPLSQDLTLTPGQTYVLSFDYAAAQLRNASGPTCEQWVVTIGGSVSGSASTLAEPTCPSNTSLPAGSTTSAYVVTSYLDTWTTMPLLQIPVGCPSVLSDK